MDGEPEVEEKPPRSPFVRIGWTIAGGACLVAFVANGLLAQGPTVYEDAAAATHRLALVTMLVGMSLAMIGHRLNWMALRSPPAAPPVPPWNVTPSVGLSPPPPPGYVPPALPPLQVSPWAETALRAQAGERDGGLAGERDRPLDAQVIDAAASGSSPFAAQAAGAGREAATVAEGSAREAVVGMAFVGCSTVWIAIQQLVLLLARPQISGPVAMLGVLLLWVALALAAWFGRGYLRAFAIGALLPTSLLVLLTPWLLDWMFSPQRGWGMTTTGMWPIVWMMYGLFGILPAGAFGAFLAAALRAAANPERYRSSSS